MIIELVHPLHGTKHAYLEAEAAADEKNGWKRLVKTTAVATATAEELAALPPVVLLKRKPGRPKGS